MRHDYACGKCGMRFEVTFASYRDFRKEWPCSNCGGVAIQIWLQAPGLAGVHEPGERGVARSFEPGWDIQSGRYFHDRAERDRYVKGRGLELMGPKEWDRTWKNLPSERQPDRATLEAAAQKSWERLQAGEKPEKMEPFTPDQSDMEAKP